MGFNYVVLEVSKDGSSIKRLLPIVYPDLLCHDEVANAIANLPSLSKYSVKPLSAGNCQIDCLDASGKSSTLNISARDSDVDTETELAHADQRLINSFPYCHGIE